MDPYQPRYAATSTAYPPAMGPVVSPAPTSHAPIPASGAARLFAYLVDLICVVGPGLVFFLLGFSWWVVALVCAVLTLVISIFRGVGGRTLGTSLTRTKAARHGTTNPPGVVRQLARTFMLALLHVTIIGPAVSIAFGTGGRDWVDRFCGTWSVRLDDPVVPVGGAAGAAAPAVLGAAPTGQTGPALTAPVPAAGQTPAPAPAPAPQAPPVHAPAHAQIPPAVAAGAVTPQASAPLPPPAPTAAPTPTQPPTPTPASAPNPAPASSMAPPNPIPASPISAPTVAAYPAADTPSAQVPGLPSRTRTGGLETRIPPLARPAASASTEDAAPEPPETQTRMRVTRTQKQAADNAIDDFPTRIIELSSVNIPPGDRGSSWSTPRRISRENGAQDRGQYDFNSSVLPPQDDSSLWIVVDSGQSEKLDAALVLGRAPTTTNAAARTVPIADPTRTLSRTHLTVCPSGDKAWVEDAYSANGTRIEYPDGTIEALTGGMRVEIAEGTIIHAGERSLSLVRSAQR